MEEFSIKGEGNLINIVFDEVFGFPDTTCHWGGYEVRATLIIKSSNFHVKATLWTSTGEIYEFLQSIKQCNNELKGEASYKSYEGNIELKAKYDNLGHVNIKGQFSEQNELDNKLKFEFNTDQTFISLTVKELELIALKYGGLKGIKK